MPVQTVAAIGALRLGLPLLAWALFSRPDKARQPVVANLQRGLGPAAGALDAAGEKRSRTSRRPLVLRLNSPGTVRRLDLRSVGSTICVACRIRRSATAASTPSSPSSSRGRHLADEVTR